MLSRNGFTLLPLTGSAASSEGTVTATVKLLEPASPNTGNYLRVHLVAGEDTFTLAALDISSFGVEVGDSVELSWIHFPDYIYPARSRLSLQHAGRRVFSYMLRMNELPGGFSYGWGAEQCRGRRSCSTWDSKKLRLTGPCGDTVELGTDERGAVCGYDVVAGFLQYRLPQYRDGCRDHSTTGIELTIAQPSADDDRDAGSP